MRGPRYNTILKNDPEPTVRGSKSFGSTGISSCLTTVQTATNLLQIPSYSYDDAIKELGYDPVKEFPEVFPSEKPTELPPLRHINHSIDIIVQEIHQKMRPRRIRPTENFFTTIKRKDRPRTSIRQNISYPGFICMQHVYDPEA